MTLRVYILINFNSFNFSFFELRLQKEWWTSWNPPGKSYQLVTNTETMFTFTAQHWLYWSSQSWEPHSPEVSWDQLSHRSCDEGGASLFNLKVDLCHLHKCRCKIRKSIWCVFIEFFPQSVRTTAVCIKHLWYWKQTVQFMVASNVCTQKCSHHAGGS